MDKSINEILHSMPQFVEAVNQLKKNKRKTGFMYGIANPDEQYTFFKSKNKRGYHSDCPFYAGYYLDGVHGATKCSCLEILLPGGVLLSDNVLHDGDTIESRFAVERRDRTTHSRLREYLYELTHSDDYVTSVLNVADGMSISVRQ